MIPDKIKTQAIAFAISQKDIVGIYARVAQSSTPVHEAGNAVFTFAPADDSPLETDPLNENWSRVGTVYPLQ